MNNSILTYSFSSVLLDKNAITITNYPTTCISQEGFVLLKPWRDFTFLDIEWRDICCADIRTKSYRHICCADIWTISFWHIWCADIWTLLRLRLGCRGALSQVPIGDQVAQTNSVFFITLFNCWVCCVKEKKLKMTKKIGGGNHTNLSNPKGYRGRCISPSYFIIPYLE